jgi:hypothetical protein
MKLFVVSGCDPSAVYLISRLREAGMLDRLVRVVWRAPVVRGARRFRSLGSRLGRRVGDQYLEWRHRRLNEEVSRALFGSGRPPSIRVDETVVASDINEPAFAARLSRAAPDLMLLQGAPILQPSVYEIPKLGTLNLHLGVAPAYRGSFTLFWALYHGDYEHLGATLHYVDRGIDSGPTVGHAFPSLTAEDTEATVIAKCTQAGTDLVIASLSAGEAPRAVASIGRGHNYKKRERRPWHDANLWLKRRLGVVRIPNRGGCVHELD